MIGVHHLSKKFLNSGDVILAVDDVSFVVGAGEVYGLLGPNGAGKTTTLRIILGLMPPTDGYADVSGYRSSVYPEEVKARIGFVSTGAGLYQWLSVREFLLFFADVYGVPQPQAFEMLDKLVELLALTKFIDQRCATLSTGQKQRVVLARALIHDPPVVLMDEPTRGLDVVGSQVVFDYIEHLRQEGKAVIVCTHRLEQAQRTCDRFGLLHQGRLTHEGDLAHLKRETGCESLIDMFRKILDATPALAEETS